MLRHRKWILCVYVIILCFKLCLVLGHNHTHDPLELENNYTEVVHSAVHFNSTIRFVKLTLETDPEWLNLSDVNHHLNSHTHGQSSGYFDMTGLPIYSKFGLADFSADYFPTSARFVEEATELISGIDIDETRIFLNNFTKFTNRLASSSHGQKAGEWLLNQLNAIANSSILSITISEFTGPNWEYGQRSIIARINGSDSRLKLQKETVILGANIDSINLYKKFKPCKNLFYCPGMEAPGADDNASGAAVLFEAFKIIAEDGFTPRRSLEFHWYAATEFGLRGSLTIASNYKEKNIRVVGMLSVAMAGYLPTSVYEPYHPNPKNTLKIAIHVKETAPQLNDFLRVLVDTYLNAGYEDKIFCVGCYADYASWTEFSYPSAFVYGSEYSPEHHRHTDTPDTINFQYLKEFIKLALAFAVEFAEPLEQSYELT